MSTVAGEGALKVNLMIFLLLEAVKKLMSDYSLRAQLIDDGFANVQRYSLPSIVDFDNVYCQVLHT